MNGQRSRQGQWPPSSLLGDLSPSTREAFLELGTRLDVGAGRVLLREGEHTTHVLLLLDGLVKVTANTAEGRLALLAIRVGGEVVGELGSLDDQPRSATVTTAGRVCSRVITQPAFHHFLAHHSDASLAVSRTVAGKLRWATRRRIDFGGCVVKVRLARVLVDLATGYGHRTAEGVVIGVSLTQPELAALVGAAEPTVHKALAGLRRRQVVVTRYRQIIVVDFAELCRAAELPADPVL